MPMDFPMICKEDTLLLYYCERNRNYLAVNPRLNICTHCKVVCIIGFISSIILKRQNNMFNNNVKSRFTDFLKSMFTRVT